MHPIAGNSTTIALQYLDDLFGRRGRTGIVMATRALQFGMPEAAIETLSVSYTETLIRSAH
jgi:hypothetical protein